MADPLISAGKHVLRSLARGVRHVLRWIVRTVTWPVRVWWRAIRRAGWLGRAGLAALAGAVALVAWLAFTVPWPGYLFTPPYRAVQYGPLNDLQYLRPGTSATGEATWQGWTAEERQLYYQHPQGSAQVMLAHMRYAWFVNLEKAIGREKFAAPANMARYGFLTDIQQRPDPRWNPGNLPVGFTRYYDERLNAELLDFTCSLCHTGELHYRGTAIRVLGGPALHAITDMKPGQFQMEMMSALLATYLNPVKFNRFAHAVIDPTVPESLRDGFDFDAARKQLRSQVGVTIRTLLANAWSDLRHGNYPVFEGYGRIDAVQRIANTVFGQAVSASNFRAGTAPVNYPFLWDISKFNWVQYEGYASQPMARNINESLGTGARLDAFDEHGAPLPMHLRYGTSIQPDHLHAIERTLAKLEAPRWPENLFGKIDAEKARKGRALFDVNCRHCHGPHTGPADVDPDALPDEDIAVPLHYHTRDDCSDEGSCDANGVCRIKGACPQIVTCALTVLDESQPGGGATAPPKTRDLQLSDQQCLNLQNPQRVADVDGNLLYKLDGEGRVIGLACDPSKPECKGRPDHVPEWQISLLSIRDVGTDRHAALNFANNRYDASRLGWTAEQLQELCLPEDEIERIGDAKQVSAVEGLNIMSLSVARRYFKEHPAATPEELMKYMGYGILDFPRTDPAMLKNYKSRPLHGVWATPPFLHNGSVRTIFQMISPREEREREFWSGTREYDPVHLGYQNLDVPGAVRFRTDVIGNDNVGHEFRDGCQSNGVIGRHLEEHERYEILEYIKVMDYTAGDDDYEPALCPSDPAKLNAAEQAEQKAACFAAIRALKAAEAARTPEWGTVRFRNSRSERHCSDDALIYGDAMPKTPQRDGVWDSWSQVSNKKCSVYRMLRNLEGTPVGQ